MSLNLGMVKGAGYVVELLAVLKFVRKAGQSLTLFNNTVIQALATAILHTLNQHQVLLGLDSGPSPQ